MSGEGLAPAQAAQGPGGTYNELVSVAALLNPHFSLVTATVCMRKEGRGTPACSLFCWVFFFQFIKNREEILGIQDFFLCIDFVF